MGIKTIFAEYTKTLLRYIQNEDFERLLVKCTTQEIPAKESLQHCCDRNKVLYNLFDRDKGHQVLLQSISDLKDLVKLPRKVKFKNTSYR